MPPLPITSIVAALLAIAMVPLSLQISMRRVRLDSVVFGDAEDEELRRKIRAHGNYIEYVPTGLIALMLVELAGATALLVWTLGGSFLLSRTLCAIGMLMGSTPMRGAGMILTHVMFLASGGWLLYTFIG
jgi:uncharacterized membrane protein YecN with MAPEG domain